MPSGREGGIVTGQLCTTSYCETCNALRLPALRSDNTCMVCGGALRGEVNQEPEPNISAAEVDPVIPTSPAILSYDAIREQADAVLSSLALDFASLEGADIGPRSGGGAAESVVAALPRFPLSANSWILHTTTLFLQRCEDSSGSTVELEGPLATLEALFGEFSPPPIDGTRVRGRMAYCTASMNELGPAHLLSSIALVDRGEISFAQKALKAQAYGAIAAIIVNSEKAVWPFVMQDSAGEAALGGLQIPCVMIPYSCGQRLKTMLDSSICELKVSVSGAECPVCQEVFADGALIIRLPCGHLFDESCAIRWLQGHNTCPMCRQELQRPGSAVKGPPQWEHWFS